MTFYEQNNEGHWGGRYRKLPTFDVTRNGDMSPKMSPGIRLWVLGNVIPVGQKLLKIVIDVRGWKQTAHSVMKASTSHL